MYSIIHSQLHISLVDIYRILNTIKMISAHGFVLMRLAHIALLECISATR